MCVPTDCLHSVLIRLLPWAFKVRIIIYPLDRTSSFLSLVLHACYKYIKVAILDHFLRQNSICIYRNLHCACRSHGQNAITATAIDCVSPVALRGL